MKSILKSVNDSDMIVEGSQNILNQLPNNGMYFTDGVRRIDFVLVYQRVNDNKISQSKRKSFLKTLIKKGLEIEIQDDSGYLHPLNEFAPLNKKFKESPDKNDSPFHRSNIVFVKVYASWETLRLYAEIMKIRKPMLNLGIDYDFNRKTFMQRIFEKFDFLNVFNINAKELQPLPRGFTWPFSTSKEYLFDIPDDHSKFFTPTERSIIVNYILRRAKYKHVSDKCSIDITDLDVLEEIVNKGNDIEMATINGAEEPNPNVDSSSLIKPELVSTIGKTRIPEYEDGRPVTMDFGIAKLISEGVFESSYILHEPSKKPLIGNHHENDSKDNLRNLLYKYWVSMRNIFRLQPLDHIRLYFGEKVAFYFAWLGYYTYWLFPISILGILVTVYNVAFASSDIVVNEIFRAKNTTMCPLICSRKGCKFWTLSDAYYRYFIIRILDNGATVILAIVMSIWASLFLEMWKRQQSKLAYRWNVHDMEYEDEPPRPEFVTLIDKKYPKKNHPITGNPEPFIPFWREKIPVMFFTYSTVLLSIILALAFLAAIIIYKLVTYTQLRMLPNKMVSNTMSSLITAATGSMISLITIMSLTLVYSKVAVWLTDLEHHRTQSQYDSSVTLKLYLLEFINNYSSIFYIGFIQPYTLLSPDSIIIKRNTTSTNVSPIKPKGCPAGGCLLDLSMQLAFIMIGKQIISHIKEYSIPRLMSSIKYYKLKKLEKKHNFQTEFDMQQLNVQSTITNGETIEVAVKDPNKAIDMNNPENANFHKVEPELVRCYADNLLTDPGPRPLFGEYLEMLIQFGFITIFIPAFPLAPLLALINNLLEIRSDALKFVRAIRRPVAQRVKDIGIWISILSIVAKVAVKSNAILIAFGTTYIDRLSYLIFYTKDGTLNGFTEFSLSFMESSKFNKSYPETYCRYTAYRYSPWNTENQPYSYTAVFWQVLAAKVIFVYLFENLVLLFMAIISVVIPDVPKNLRISMKREAVLTNEIILKAELNRHKNQNATKLIAESFKKSAMLVKKEHKSFFHGFKQRNKQKANTRSLASQILMKSAKDSH